MATPTWSMATYVGLLRAVNLGSHNKIAMSDLREWLTGLGMSNPRTLLQSGNMVFDAAARSAPQLERTLESAAVKQLGLETPFFVRTDREWHGIIADNPFPKEAKTDPGHLVMMCLKDAPGATAVKALQDAIGGRELVRANGRQAYFVYPDGIGRSRLTITLIEKQLGTIGTARNWNTVLKLAVLTGTS